MPYRRGRTTLIRTPKKSEIQGTESSKSLLVWGPILLYDRAGDYSNYGAYRINCHGMPRPVPGVYDAIQCS